MIEINKVYQGDSAELMKEIPDNFIDLTVTSPPYDNLRDYKGYSFDFETIAKELYRVTKSGGVVVWVVNDSTVNGSESGTSFRQALFFMSVGFNLHDTMIYAKKNYVPLTHNRYEQQFEYMFVFSKRKPNTFNPLMIKSVSAGSKKHMGYVVATTKENSSMRSGRDETVIIKEYKYRPNIFFYSVGSNQSTKERYVFESHSAVFPEQLAYDMIHSWSNKKDLVFDPFAGSGTTLKMAKLMNRTYLGFEIAEEYIPIIIKRLGQETVLAFCSTETHNRNLTEDFAKSSQINPTD